MESKMLPRLLKAERAQTQWSPAAWHSKPGCWGKRWCRSTDHPAKIVHNVQHNRRTFLVQVRGSKVESREAKDNGESGVVVKRRWGWRDDFKDIKNVLLFIWLWTFIQSLWNLQLLARHILRTITTQESYWLHKIESMLTPERRCFKFNRGGDAHVTVHILVN